MFGKNIYTQRCVKFWWYVFQLWWMCELSMDHICMKRRTLTIVVYHIQTYVQIFCSRNSPSCPITIGNGSPRRTSRKIKKRWVDINKKKRNNTILVLNIEVYIIWKVPWKRWGTNFYWVVYCESFWKIFLICMCYNNYTISYLLTGGHESKIHTLIDLYRVNKNLGLFKFT